MHRPRLLSTFALASLLLGNLAGWVHVGQHAAGVCCDALVQPAVVATEQDCCEAHGCGSNQGSKTELSQPTDKRRSEWPHDSAPRPPHDGENCVVCHYFESTRDGWAWSINTPAVETEARSDDSAIADDDFRSMEPRHVCFLRGPPVV